MFKLSVAIIAVLTAQIILAQDTLIKIDKTDDPSVSVLMDSLIIPEFEEVFHEEWEATVLHPKFSDFQKSLDNKQIEIKGFLLGFDITEDDLFLADTLASSGDDIYYMRFKVSIGIENINLNQDQIKKVFNSEVIIRGKLILNSTDVMKLNYLLEDVNLIE